MIRSQSEERAGLPEAGFDEGPVVDSILPSSFSDRAFPAGEAACGEAARPRCALSGGRGFQIVLGSRGF